MIYFNQNANNEQVNNNLNVMNDKRISNGNYALNPSSAIFCPTSRVKCVSQFNEFPKNFNLVYANLQGMFEACHFDEFRNAISKSKHVSCMVIVETWLRHRVNQNKTCAIQGFKLFRSDRHSRSGDRNKGGGVAMYVADGLRVNTLERSFTNDHGILNTDFIFIEITTKLSKILVCGIYRTSKCSKTHTEKLFDLISETAARYDNVIIIGDFNLDVLSNCNTVASLCVNFGIINHYCPTHYWPNAQPSLIDIAFTKWINRVQLFAHFNLIPSTHHDVIIVSYRSRNFINKKKTSFSFDDYNKIDSEKLVHEAEMINWNELFHEKCIDKKVEILNKNYFELFASNVPKTIVRIRHDSNNWFNQELNLKINERKRLYDVYTACKNDEMSDRVDIESAKNDYMRQCKHVNNYINYLKKERFERDLMESRSHKDFWKVIKNTGCSKENTGIELSHNIDINLLNDHFVNIHSSSMTSLPVRRSYELFFDFNFIDIGDLDFAIKNITSNAIGHDGVSLKFLKLIFTYFADAIIDIIRFGVQIFPNFGI